MISWTKESFDRFELGLKGAIRVMSWELDTTIDLTLGITGGREFSDSNLTVYILNQVKRALPVRKFIHGNAKGADSLGKHWAMNNRLTVQSLPARWIKDGNAAGPLRNTELLHRLLDEPSAALVVMPGGDGTGDMHSKSVDAGLSILDVPFLLTQAGAEFVDP
jgi:hypothetical protein